MKDERAKLFIDAVGPHRAGGVFCAVSAALVMDAAAIGRAITRMAHEIAERNPDEAGLAVIGIRTHGVPLAQRLIELDDSRLKDAEALAKLLDIPVQVAALVLAMKKEKTP